MPTFGLQKMDWAHFWSAKNGLGSLLVGKKWTGITFGRQKLDWSTFSITGPLCSAKVGLPGSFLAEKIGPTGTHFVGSSFCVTGVGVYFC